MHDVAQLRARLDELLRIAKNNERKQQNFQQYELSLLNAGSLQELLSIILDQHKERFQLSEVTLLLLDPEYEFRRLLKNNRSLPDWENRLLFSESVQLVAQYFSLRRTPRLGPFSPHLHQQLFPARHDLKSVALLPLLRQHTLIGSLNLGSRSPSRFESGIGTQFLQHLAAVVSACIENARLHEQIKLVGLHDPLTGINNRRFFDQRIGEEVEWARRYHLPLSCLFIDLDHFKRVNDEHGHQAGDAVLVAVARLLGERLRSTDVLARFGGEEFVILLPNTSTRDAMEIAEQIRRRVAAQRFPLPSGEDVSLTLSIGVATLSLQSAIDSSKQLLEAADQAVYAAKLNGRNQARHAR